MSIKVTDNAFQRIGELIKREKTLDLVLRVSVDGGGCKGYIYNYTFVPINDITEDDNIFHNGITQVVIDKESTQLMSGCIVDFIEELGKSYFTIINPMVKGKCGCGNSFTI